MRRRCHPVRWLRGNGTCLWGVPFELGRDMQPKGPPPPRGPPSSHPGADRRGRRGHSGGPPDLCADRLPYVPLRAQAQAPPHASLPGGPGLGDAPRSARPRAQRLRLSSQRAARRCQARGDELPPPLAKPRPRPRPHQRRRHHVRRRHPGRAEACPAHPGHFCADLLPPQEAKCRGQPGWGRCLRAPAAALAAGHLPDAAAGGGGFGRPWESGEAKQEGLDRQRWGQRRPHCRRPRAIQV
mmetsp:Transcript_12246/g.31613  ORF Transcript_12246/g.31613 Transcript_12246/m.31613 type:complete len:240 (-) Transcript_12246:192-911(-)